MDKASEAKERWSWLPVAMPKVAQLVVEHRARWGAAHVAACWANGMAGKPGWFFAREGAVAIGTPWTEQQDKVLAAVTRWDVTSTQAMVFMRAPEAANGTH